MRVVFIHGQAAAGKLTVALALGRRTGLPVFHNHVAVDAALALFEFGTPGFIALRHSIWLTAFEQAAAAGRSFIFTFQPEGSVPESFVAEALRAIESRGGHVVFVELRCSEAEIERRIGNESRSAYRKLTSLALYETLRAQGAFDYPPLPSAVSVDTSQKSPEEAAAFIESFLAK